MIWTVKGSNLSTILSTRSTLTEPRWLQCWGPNRRCRRRPTNTRSTSPRPQPRVLAIISFPAPRRISTSPFSTLRYLRRPEALEQVFLDPSIGEEHLSYWPCILLIFWWRCCVLKPFAFQTPFQSIMKPIHLTFICFKTIKQSFFSRIRTFAF